MAQLFSDVIGVVCSFLESQQQVSQVNHTWRRGALEQDGGRPKPNAAWDWDALRQRQPAVLKLPPGGCDDDLLSLHLHITTSSAWVTTNLLRISMFGCHDITDDGIQHLATALPALTDIDISWCNKITDAGIKHLSALTALRKLDISGCYRTTDAGVEHLKALTALNTIDISRCPHVTDVGMKHLATLNGLTKIDVRYCDRITDAGMLHLAGLPALTEIDVSGCEEITDAGLQHLSKCGQ
mgnify:CR=1 FL=1